MLLTISFLCICSTKTKGNLKMGFNVSKVGKSLENIAQNVSKKVSKIDSAPVQKSIKQGGLKLLSSLESMATNAQAAIKKNANIAADTLKNNAISAMDACAKKSAPLKKTALVSGPACIETTVDYQEIINAKKALSALTGKKANKSAFKSAQAIIKEQRLNPLSNKSAKESAEIFERVGKSEFEKSLDKADSLKKQAQLKIKLQTELAPKIRIEQTKARLLEKYSDKI